MTMTTTFASILQEFAEAFETRTRNDGTRFTCFRDDCPAWCDSDVMHGIHLRLDDRFPDDWVYEMTSRIAEGLTDRDVEEEDDARDALSEIADGLVDVYYADRLKWLASHLNNALFIDEAREEGLISKDARICDQIGSGQNVAIERIGSAVIAVVEDELNSRNND